MTHYGVKQMTPQQKLDRLEKLNHQMYFTDAGVRRMNLKGQFKQAHKLLKDDIANLEMRIEELENRIDILTNRRN